MSVNCHKCQNNLNDYYKKQSLRTLGVQSDCFFVKILLQPAGRTVGLEFQPTMCVSLPLT